MYVSSHGSKRGTPKPQLRHKNKKDMPKGLAGAIQQNHRGLYKTIWAQLPIKRPYIKPYKNAKALTRHKKAF